MTTADNYDGEIVDWPIAAGPFGTLPPLYQRLQADGTPCRLRMPSKDVFWLFTRREDIRAIATDRRFSRDLTHDHAPRLSRGPDFQSLPGGIFNLDPPRHTVVRDVVNPFYTKEAAESWRPMMHSVAVQLTDAMRAGPDVADLIADYAEPLALRTSAVVLGIPLELRATYMEAFRVQTDFEVTHEVISDALTAIKSLAEALVDDRIASPEGPIGALVDAHQRRTISRDEMISSVVYLLVTSTEPIIGPVATFTLTLLREHPHVAIDTLCRRPELWPDAISELLRMHHNTLIGLPRRAIEDVQVGDILIRAGDGVIVSHLAATMDPAAVPNPEHFTIMRGDDARLTFGSGPHYCLGSNLARVYLHEALQTLLTQLPKLMLAVHALDVPWSAPETLFIRPLKLPVVF